MKKFIQRLTAFSLGPLIAAVISILQIHILTRFLSPEEYGVSGLYRNLMLNLPNFLYLGLDQAYSREFHQYKRVKSLFLQAVFPAIAFGSLLAIIMLIFQEGLSNWLFGSSHYGILIVFSALLILSSILERFVLLSIRMQEKAKEYSAFTILLKLLIFFASILGILLGQRDFQVVVWGMIWGQLLGDGLLFWRYRSWLQPTNWHWDSELNGRLLRFGLPLTVAMTLNVILNTVDHVALKTLSNNHELGVYTATLGIINMLAIFKTAFATFWTPTAYRWYDEGKAIKHFKFISDALLLILTIVYFAILVLSPIFVKILDQEYRAGRVLFGLLSFPHIMYTLSETTTLGIVFSRRTYFNIYVSLFALVPSLLLNGWLTPKFGALGSATASCVAYLAFYGARTYFSSRSGFYFGQSKQLMAIIIMLIAALVNVYVVNPFVMIALGFLCVLVQWQTFRDGWSIYRQSDAWEFN